ncbi:UDP-glycosyltransferase 73C3 [Linum grandiflorum]
MTKTKTQEEVHFLLFPFMAQGHMIPMVDIAKLLATRGSKVTIVTTPLNAARFESPLRRRSNHLIDLVELRFPCLEAGLPEGCENVDMLPSFAYVQSLMKAAAMMEPQVESLLENMKVKPDCIISDFCLPYVGNVAKKFDIPRVSFQGFGCFSLMCLQCIMVHEEEICRRASSDFEYFVLPGMPGEIKFSNVQLPLPVRRQI